MENLTLAINVCSFYEEYVVIFVTSLVNLVLGHKGTLRPPIQGTTSLIHFTP